ncbi:MAG: PD40 domain-containing protein [Bacteroidales bacterium]|nr:PD40 domain-containing protein [Bacteroidales bacterium]
MKVFKKGILVIATALFCVATVFGQEKSITVKADKLFDQKRYVEALESYQSAYKKIKSNRAEKNRINFQIGECYRMMNNYPKAELIYNRLIKNARYYIVEPKIYYYLAEMYRFQNEFDKATENYDNYLKLQPDDQLARERRGSLVDLSRMLSDRTRHNIITMDKYNTDYDDWSPHFVGDDTNTLVFTSSRFLEEDEAVDAWTGKAFSELFAIMQDKKGNWTSVDLYEKGGMINTPVNEGEAVFTPDGSVMYFSRCDSKEYEMKGCYIYRSTLGGGDDKKKRKKKTDKSLDKWNEAERINLGDTAFNYLHPAITADELTLYFSSNLPGGEGSYDIWMAKRNTKDEEFGTPINLGKVINTSGRENFPTINFDTMLYFSSDGHPGVGGLDIYKTYEKGDNVWATPENLKVPINSSFDEMGIVFYPEGSNPNFLERGYFASNRTVADPHKKEDKDVNTRTKYKPINDDLFYFELPPLLYSIEGIVRDEKSMQLLPETKIKLVGSDGSETETYTDGGGKYRFGNDAVKHNVIYKMYISRLNYFSTEGSESTFGYTTNKDIVHDFRLEPVPNEPVVLPDIQYGLSKWDLTTDYQDSLTDLYLVLMNNPNIVVEIRSHTDCRPYIALTNDTLSQRRAQSVVDFLISRGIEPERIVAKGYAEREPRKLTKDMVVKYAGKEFKFEAGTVLECDYIELLQGKDYQEAAHQLNRRTEFKVIRDDFVSRRLVDNMASETPIAKETEDGKVIDLVNKPIEIDMGKPEIVHDENTIPVKMIQSTKGEVDVIVNGAKKQMLIDEKYREPVAISWEEAMNYIYQKRLTKEDFPARDDAFDYHGNIIDKSMVILNSVQIGQKRVEKVEAIVLKGLDYKFVINRLGLEEFGEYDFDKQNGKLIFID